MAATLFTRGPVLRRLQRDLCRVVWRTQVATFSSEPSDKKTRRTHIKKAKPEPRVEINELVEKIFSQKRPDGARSARSAKSTSNPWTNHSVKRSTSDRQTKHAGTILSAASRSKQPDGVHRKAALFTAQSFLQQDSSNVHVSNPPSDVDLHSMSASHHQTSSEKKAAPEPSSSTNTAVELSVEHLVDHTIEFSAEESLTTNVSISHLNKEFFRESDVVSAVEICFPKEALESSSQALKEEPSTVDSPLKISPHHEHLKDFPEATDRSLVSDSVKEELSIKSREESPLDSSVFIENPTVHIEGSGTLTLHQDQKEEPDISDSGIVIISKKNQEEPEIKPLIESEVESSVSVMQNLKDTERVVQGPVEALTETPVESKLDEVLSLDGASEMDSKQAQTSTISLTMKTESEVVEVIPVESVTITNAEDELSHKDLTQAEDVETKVKEPEKLTLESVTLHSITSSIESLQSDELHQTKAALDEQASVIQETEFTASADSESETEDETETLTETLSKWESLSEDLEGLEGEGGTLVNELLCSIPAVVSKRPELPNMTSACDQPKAVMKDSNTSDEDPAMTLESLTLAEIKAEVGSLDSEVLQDTCKSLEREADMLEKDVEKIPEEVVDLFEDTIEAQISDVCISEATDAIEAETAIMMEAMFGSEQGPKQMTKDSLQELSLTKEAELKQDGEGVVEAMSLESVTLAEVEASLGAMGNNSFTETVEYLEKESEMFAEKKTMSEEGSAVESSTRDLRFDPVSVPEDDVLPEDMETDALVEELFFTVPVHTAKDVKDEKSVNGTEGNQEEEEHVAVQSDLDPVQILFLEKIREYSDVSRLNRRLIEAEPEYVKRLSDETTKLQRLYGGGDLSSFPQFSFTEPELEQDPK